MLEGNTYEKMQYYEKLFARVFFCRPRCGLYKTRVFKLFSFFSKKIQRRVYSQRDFSHTKEMPLHVIFNPLEEKCIVRLEFQRPEIVRFLIKRCMSFDGKRVLVLPCR